jgi:two-component system, cell cycle sensor histidine kinase and response regulator CckA
LGCFAAGTLPILAESRFVPKPSTLLPIFTTDSRTNEYSAERFLVLARVLQCVIHPERSHIVWSPAVRVVLGYNDGELSPLSIAKLVHPDDRPATDAHLARIRAGTGERAFRCRLRHRDGTYRWIGWECTKAGDTGVVLAAGTDVTEALHAAERLHASEERFRALDSSTQIGLFETDARGTLTYANHRLQEIWGAEHSELADGSWIDRVHSADVPRLLASLKHGHTVASKREESYRLLLPDGTLRRVSINTTLRHDDHGAVIGASGMVEDVTERWILEEQLRQAQKMEAVGQLAAGVAHDFNNLLIVIKTYSEFILEQLEETSAVRADAIEIQKAVGRAGALTRQLLAFSRKQALLPRPLCLNEIVTGMEPMLRRLIGEDIEIDLNTDPQLGAVKADASQLEQVVMNLTVNARDAMSNGGTISIQTSGIVLTETMRAGHGVIPGPYVSLVVRDTGCGMDKATRARVFEPFFTTKELGRGTGLGLSMVYGIVKQSEGYIWCDSTEDVGTTFTVLLPQLPGTGELPKEPREPVLERVSAVVLLTEDEDAIRALGRRILEREGYTVLEARDGRDAIRVAAGYPSRIDLLITDMVMPNLGGRELFVHLRLLRPDLRVLFVSGYTDDDDIRRGLKDVASAFLQKPFTARALATAARTALTT